MLKRLGETEVAEAEIPDRLAKAADELLRLRADLARLSNDRPEFAAIRARASALIDKGDFDAARAALNEGRERARALREEASRTEAGFLADEARVDRLQLNYDAACAKFAEAARLDPDNVWLWIELGDLWVTRGSLAEADEGLFRRARRRHAKWRRSRSLGVVRQDWRRAGRAGRPRRRAEVLPRRPRDRRPPGAIRSRQRRLAARSLGVVREDRRRAGRAGRPRRRADFLQRQPRDLIDRLAKSDPGNAGWQRDLSVSYEKIGDVQVAQGDLAGALNSYRDSLAIIDRLAKSDPGNAGWQRDLSVSTTRLATCRSRRATSPGR